ncbi:GNAT family N-acetyltransferase [Psychromarinibacter sp. C21-152]|uniref:GNAT family N-acetyltransferase n=1 Tax=Psychromarinibacter sediminicola TaxID=3033385 RepID=A0AAE3NP69_9RHOB|nr:GNAT family N-acetyltransferase [Psychromarinibacter sediminicola]MDF0600958.1 GNAT family N-acetyltransferase [Psychromarinibacter sediminicola]
MHDKTLAAAARPAADFAAFTPEHIPGALELSRAVGWPHRAEDWALTLRVSEGVVALDGDRVVGTAMRSDFGAVAALNMIIVAEDRRGCGLGQALMRRVMEPAEGREQRLVATTDGLPLYEKLGFAATGRVLQHQGTARAAAPEMPVRSGGRGDLAAFAKADLDASGTSRAALLSAILETGEMLLAEGGFAMLRPFGRGHVVGPVVARDAATARALIAEAATRRAGAFLRVDLPEATGLSDHAEALGLARAGGGVSMVRDAAPSRERAFTTYALAAQALG